jgi:cellulose synthase/poly-beta-1,6-N-acetylglucosamine synthase-like glycosyltransferase
MPHLHALAFALGLLVFLATLPGTLEIFLLTAGVALKSKRSAKSRSRNSRLAVVIPAHNEAGFIQRCVTSISASAQAVEQHEIVVIADNCTDETAALAAEAGARVLIRTDTENRGKGYALRMAFDRLQSEGFNQFLVIDADSIVSPNLVNEVSERLTAGAAAVQCRYRVADNTASLRARLMDAAFLAFNVLRPKGRSGWSVSAGIQGNGFGLRGETLQKVPYDAASIVEDLEYHLRLVAASEKVEFIDVATVYGEIPAGGEAARAQRSRWEGGRLRMAREWVPQLAAGVARGNWRFLEPLLDLLTLSLAYQVVLLLLALATPFQAYAIAALGLVLVHVLCASFLGERPGRTMAALATAPFYILWKVTTLSSVFSASRRGANWVRTGRANEADFKLVK